MNYSSLRKTLARDLRQCVRLGLPEWAKSYVDELVVRAERRWQTSQDKSQPRDIKQHCYERAVRMQDEALSLLSAYRISVRPEPERVGRFASQRGKAVQEN